MPQTKEDRVRFRKGKQRELIKISSKKVGSLRNLSKVLGVRFGYFWYYISEKVTLPKSKFEKLIEISGLNGEEVYSKYVEEILPYNWGRIKGSLETNRIIKMKLKNPEYRKKWYGKYVKLGNSLKGKMIDNWELGFRKVGKRNVVGPNGERMFNSGERGVAEFLLSKGLGYVYEPRLEFRGKVYFPDFVSGNTIVERFGMTRPFYIKRSREKLKDYIRFWKGKIIVIVPKSRLNLFNRVLPRDEKKLFVVSEETLNSMSRVA